MIFVILGIAIALACFRMGIIIGRLEIQEEFNNIRQEMGLDSSDEEWQKLFYGDDN